MQNTQIQTIGNNRLAPQSVKAIDSLPINLKPFIERINTSLISEVSPKDAEKLIYLTILKSMERAGHVKRNEDNNAVLILSSDVYSIILQKFKSLTVGEFEEACLNGCIGNYGSFMGFSLKTICDWIKEYLGSHERKSAIKAWHKAIDEQILKVTDRPVTDMARADKAAFIRAFEDYKTTKRMPIAAWSHYDGINELIGTEVDGRKTLILKKEDRVKVKSESEKEYDDYIKFGVRERKSKGLFSEAEKLAEMFSKRDNSIFEHMVKKNALKSFYETLIKENKQLNELL